MNKPTKEGYYWAKNHVYDREFKIVEVYCIEGDLCCVMMGEDHYYEINEFEWGEEIIRRPNNRANIRSKLEGMSDEDILFWVKSTMIDYDNKHS